MRLFIYAKVNASLYFNMIRIIRIITVTFLFFFLTGCDVLYVKRMDLPKPNNILELKNYKKEKDLILSVIDQFVLNMGMSCKQNRDLSRFCTKSPLTLVAFENKSGFVMCLFKLGTSWEKKKFFQLSDSLQLKIKNKLHSEQVVFSLPEEVPECEVPYRE